MTHAARLRTILGVLISIVLLWLALHGVDFAALWRALQGAQYWWLLPAIAVYFEGVWMRAVRWRVLLAPVRQVPARRLFPVIAVGYMANDLLPARLGEVVRVYMLGRREGIGKTAALATVMLERVLDGVTMLLFLGIAMLLVPLESWLVRLLGAGAALFAGALLALLLLARASPVVVRLVELAAVILPSSLRPWPVRLAGAFLDGLHVLRSPLLTVKALGASVAAWTCEALMYYLVALAFALTPPPAAILATTAVANLGTLVPSSPGYIGPFEFLVRRTLEAFGVGAEVALGYALVLHVVLLLPIILVGLFYAWKEHVTILELGSRGDAPRLGSRVPNSGARSERAPLEPVSGAQEYRRGVEQ
jgi:uncharacterized membrane protein YbhN (UPF0104 family)